MLEIHVTFPLESSDVTEIYFCLMQ